MGRSAFTVGGAVGFGWSEVTENLGFWVGTMLVVLVIALGPDLVAHWIPSMGGLGTLLALLLSLLGFLLYLLVQVGLIDVALRIVDGRSARIGDLFSRTDRLLAFFFATLLFTLGVGVGMLFFIVPGLILFVVWAFYAYEVVDEGAGAIESLGGSLSVTKGQRVQIFLLILALVGLNLLGAVALLVGLLVTIPTSILAFAYAYRQLKGYRTGAGTADVGIGT